MVVAVWVVLAADGLLLLDVPGLRFLHSLRSLGSAY